MLNLALLLPHWVTSDIQTGVKTEAEEKESFLEWQSPNRAVLLSPHLLSSFRKVTYQFMTVFVKQE